MKGVPQGRYTKEFREEAVKLVVEEKLSMPEAARRLSLPPSTLVTWVKACKVGRLGEIGRTQRPLTEIEMELARIMKESVEVIDKSRRVLYEGFTFRYAVMKGPRLHYPLPLVRRVLSVSAGGYYN